MGSSFTGLQEARRNLRAEISGWNFEQVVNRARAAEIFEQRGENYRNVIDPSTGFARGRHMDESWAKPFDPAVQYSYITEGLPYQYTFFVPQDVPGLAHLVGGRQAFIDKLDTLFTKGYYDQSNEPSQSNCLSI